MTTIASTQQMTIKPTNS